MRLDRPAQLTQEDKTRIARLHEQGLSGAEIAAIIHRSKSSVNRAVRELGLTTEKENVSPQTFECAYCGKINTIIPRRPGIKRTVCDRKCNAALQASYMHIHLTIIRRDRLFKGRKSRQGRGED